MPPAPEMPLAGRICDSCLYLPIHPPSSRSIVPAQLARCPRIDIAELPPPPRQPRNDIIGAPRCVRFKKARAAELATATCSLRSSTAFLFRRGICPRNCMAYRFSGGLPRTFSPRCWRSERNWHSGWRTWRKCTNRLPSFRPRTEKTIPNHASNRRRQTRHHSSGCRRRFNSP